MKKQASPPQNPQSGSIFVWIFVMIALFGALSYAMIQSGRQGSSNLTGEKAKLAASEILDYARIVREATKALIINGTPLQNISFSYPSKLQNGTPYDTGSVSCSTDSCSLFKHSGGGVDPINFYKYAEKDPSWQDSWNHIGSFNIVFMDFKDIGSSEADLVMEIYQLQAPICRAINVLMGNKPDVVMLDDWSSAGFYDTYDIADSIAQSNYRKVGYATPQLAGKIAYCNTDNLNRTAYIVIHAR